jgi:glyceraldehyde-3-phosphate dehydrogenase (NADP+)
MDSCLDVSRVLVDGEIIPWKGRRSDVYSPVHIRTSTALVRKRLGSYPGMTGRDALRALAAARRAFSSGSGKWPSLPLSHRVRCVERFLERLAERKEDIVRTLMWEIAKPHRELEDEFERTIGYIEQVTRIACQREKAARSLKRGKGIMGLVQDEPYGVVLCLGPYNYPLFETFSLAFPALLAGNTVLIKPPRFGVLFFDHLLEGLRDCFPPGAVGFVSGDGRTIVEPLMKSGGIDVFAFIGTRPTANRLIALHPRRNRLRSVLGLGAKNPVIVLPGADLEVAVRESILGALAFNGQRCAALKIFFVHEDIRESFQRGMSEELSQTGVGPPWIAGVRITPLADPERVPYLRELVEDAVRRGARIGNRNGGRSIRSLFVPTLLSPVRPGMKVYSEEQFGPLIPLVSYDKIERPVRYITRSPFGQQLSIFGTEVETLACLVRSVRSQVARININAKSQRGPDFFPFSGRKDSAKGDFSAPEILNAFSAKSVVAARENEWSEAVFRRLRRLDHQGPDGKADDAESRGAV